LTLSFVNDITFRPNTYGNVNVKGGSQRGLEMLTESQDSEHDGVPWLIDGFVGLYEHRVALMDVHESGGVSEVKTSSSSYAYIVVTRTYVAHLNTKIIKSR
jgi:hypothetical protein